MLSVSRTDKASHHSTVSIIDENIKFDQMQYCLVKFDAECQQQLVEAGSWKSTFDDWRLCFSPSFPYPTVSIVQSQHGDGTLTRSGNVNCLSSMIMHRAAEKLRIVNDNGLIIDRHSCRVNTLKREEHTELFWSYRRCCSVPCLHSAPHAAKKYLWKQVTE